MLYRLASLLLSFGLMAPVCAWAAGCQPNIAAGPRLLTPARWTPAQAAEGKVDLTYIGHASVLIESPQGVSIVTDLNDYVPPPFPPDIATMNHAHDTHYTDRPDPRIKFVLRGWDVGAGPAHWDLTYKDVRVRNVPTNVRNWMTGGTEFNGNSIFIFEIADLCIAHLGHLHHTLTAEHLAALGQIDVLLPLVDGAYSLSQHDVIEVIDQIKPRVIIPVHYFGPDQLERFITRTKGRFPVRRKPGPQIELSRANLPQQTEIWLVPPTRSETFRFAPPSQN